MSVEAWLGITCFPGLKFEKSDVPIPICETTQTCSEYAVLADFPLEKFRIAYTYNVACPLVFPNELHQYIHRPNSVFFDFFINIKSLMKLSSSNFLYCQY